MRPRVYRSHTFRFLLVGFAWAGWWLVGIPDTVLAYQVMEVQQGGTITGIVTLNGAQPEPKAYNLITFPDPEYCGRISNGDGWRLLRDFTVDKAGGQDGLKDVVV